MNRKNRIARAIADCLPQRVLYWAVMKVGTRMGLFKPDEEVPAVPFTVILQRLHDSVEGQDPVRG